jgi:hypothetical protein
VDRRPGRITYSLVGLFAFFVETPRLTGFLRRLASLQLQPDWAYQGELPKIDLLMVVADKDVAVLEYSVASALKNSLNEVSRVLVVTQRQSVDKVLTLLTPIVGTRGLTVFDENDVLDTEIRALLFEAFADRYGWVLQQFLCLAITMESDAAGVLVLDSDTLLLRERAFLAGGQQVLHPTTEHHDPYYVFLRQLDPLFGKEQHTFVSHHMLMQPAFLRSVLDRTGNSDLKLLALRAIENASKDTFSPFCIEYELYGQALMRLRPDSVTLCKWSNIGVDRPSTMSPAAYEKLLVDYGKYASISLHDYI